MTIPKLSPNNQATILQQDTTAQLNGRWKVTAVKGGAATLGTIAAITSIAIGLLSNHLVLGCGVGLMAACPIAGIAVFGAFALFCLGAYLYAHAQSKQTPEQFSMRQEALRAKNEWAELAPEMQEIAKTDYQTLNLNPQGQKIDHPNYFECTLEDESIQFSGMILAEETDYDLSEKCDGKQPSILDERKATLAKILGEKFADCGELTETQVYKKLSEVFSSLNNADALDDRVDIEGTLAARIGDRVYILNSANTRVLQKTNDTYTACSTQTKSEDYVPNDQIAVITQEAKISGPFKWTKDSEFLIFAPSHAEPLSPTDSNPSERSSTPPSRVSSAGPEEDDSMVRLDEAVPLKFDQQPFLPGHEGVGVGPDNYSPIMTQAALHKMTYESLVGIVDAEL